MKEFKNELQEMFKSIMNILNQELATMFFLREFDSCIDYYKSNHGFLFKHYINKDCSIIAERVDEELQISLVYNKEEDNIFITFPNIKEEAFEAKYIWFLYSYLNTKID